MRSLVIVLFSVATLSCSESVDTVLTRSEKNSLPLFETQPAVSQYVTYAGLRVPFPRGDWDFIGEAEFRDQVPGYPQRQAIYASVTEGVVDQVIGIWHQVKPGYGSFTPFKYCTHNTYLHSSVTANARNANSCWHLRTVNLGISGNAPDMNQVLSRFAKSRDLYLPTTMLGIRFVTTRGGWRYYTEYMYNTDLLLPKASNGIWTPDEWTKEAVDSSNLKRAVAKGLIEWGINWAPSIQLEKGLRARFLEGF